MKRRLLIIKKPGQEFIAGLFIMLVGALGAVIVAGGWFGGEGFSWGNAILCLGCTLYGSILVWSDWPAMRARNRLAAGLCAECGYDLRESKQAEVCPECGCPRRRSEAGGP